MTTPNEATFLLSALSAGDRSGIDRLFALVYQELRRLARSQLRQDPAVTLQPTALVHEVYLRLIDQSGVTWQNRAHFAAVAALMIRRVIVDYARSARTRKRGDGWRRVELGEPSSLRVDSPEDWIWVNQLIDRLKAEDARQAEILELRVFGGLTVPEVALSLGVSRRTVEADWTLIRAWLRLQLGERDQDGVGADSRR